MVECCTNCTAKANSMRSEVLSVGVRVISRAVFADTRCIHAVHSSIASKLTLYCHCRMPWRPADKKLPGIKMAECEICCKWSHQKCEGILTPFSEILPPGPVKYVQAAM